MDSSTIRQIDQRVKAQLRARADASGRSMKEEARIILYELFQLEAGSENLTSFIREYFESLDGAEQELPAQGPIREPPDFS